MPDEELRPPAGIHHVTAMVGDAQEAVDFYAGTLGLRLVKRTVNYEDMLQHHLYFGDARGTPGTVFTVFPDPHGDPGRLGRPQPSATAFAVPAGSLDFWADRLADHGVETTRETRFGEDLLTFSDPAGTPLELVAVAEAEAGAAAETDAAAEPTPRTELVPEHAAIRRIRGVTLLPVNPYATASALELLGFEHVDGAGDRVRYAKEVSGDSGVAGDTVVDVVDRDEGFGREGPGTIHHVALRAADQDALLAWREQFDERGFDVSDVKDRHLFHSLYARDPGGILFELATTEPGLAGVESVAELGESLYLPDTFEPDRELIESQLPDLELPYEIDHD
ncbi:MAG: VOC family protein [Halopenitus sp.]